MSKQIDSILTTDNYNDFMQRLKKIKTPTLEENEELFYRYKRGDKDAYEEIVERNMGLVALEAKKYFSTATSYTKMDLIQEGAIGFIRALETYNPKEGALSSYTIPWIRSFISKAIRTTDNMACFSDSFSIMSTKLNHFIDEYKKEHGVGPTDEEIKSQFEITDETLRIFRNRKIFNMRSLNAPLEEQENSNKTLIDIVSDEKDDFEEFVNRENGLYMIIALKKYLNPLEYFVFYNRVLRDRQYTLKEVSDYFGATGEWARQTQVKIQDRVKKIYRTVLPTLIEKKDLHYLENHNILPFDMDLLYRSMFLSPFLSEKEKELIVLWLNREMNYNKNYYVQKLGITVEELEEMTLKIKRLLSELESFKFLLQEFIDVEKVKYKTHIIKINLKTYIPRERAKELIELFSCNLVDYQTVNELIDEGYVEDNLVPLLKKYFFTGKRKLPMKRCNDEVNAIIFGYKRFIGLPIDTLYETFLRQKKSFTEEEEMFINAYIFEKIDEKTFIHLYPSSTIDKEAMITKLEMLAFHICSNRMTDLSESQYTSIRDILKQKVSSDELTSLDFLYGFVPNTKSSSIDDEMRLRNTAIETFLEKWEKELGEKTVYLEFLESEDFTIANTSKEITKMYLEGKTYEEINSKYENVEVKRIIRNTIGLIDALRSGSLREEDRYPKEKKLAFLETLDVDEESKKIIKMIIDKVPILEIKRTTKTSTNHIISLKTKLYNGLEASTKTDTPVDSKDITIEVSKKVSETLLNGQEKEFLSLAFGIKNGYNPQGIEYSIQEIKERMGLKATTYYILKMRSMAKIMKVKRGFYQSNLRLFKKQSLIDIIDAGFFLAPKVKTVVTLFYGLEGTAKEIDEISEELDMSVEYVTKIVKNFNRDIIKSYKEKIDFNMRSELENVYYLKFFTNDDRNVLKMYYIEGLDEEEISQKIDKTVEETRSLLLRLRLSLFNYKNDIEEVFDFEHFYSNINKSIAFIIEPRIMKNIALDYFVKSLSLEGIIKKYSLSMTPQDLLNTMSKFMLLINKASIGLSEKPLPIDEIRKLYLSSYDKLSIDDKLIYYEFFRRVKERKIDIRNRPALIVLGKYLKSKSKYIEVNSLNFLQIWSFLVKYKRHLSDDAFSSICFYFDIKRGMFMSDEDKKTVLKTVHKALREKELQKEKSVGKI